MYVGLIGLRYGSQVRNRPGVSYTELEFVAATEAGLPRLMFLLDENAALPIPAAQLQDDDPGLRARQQAFRDRLRAAGIMTVEVASPSSSRWSCCTRSRSVAWPVRPGPWPAMLEGCPGGPGW